MVFIKNTIIDTIINKANNTLTSWEQSCIFTDKSINKMTGGNNNPNALNVSLNIIKNFNLIALSIADFPL